MVSCKVIAGFLWRFILVYGLLIVPWPGFNDGYARYFRALGQMVFGREHDRRVLHFEAVPADLRHRLGTRIALANREQLDPDGAGLVYYLELDPRGLGWVPTALLLALIGATPVSWRRKGGALLWGLVAIHGFILFSVAVYLWNSSTELQLLALTPFWKKLAVGLEETLVTQMGAGFVAPVLIWIIVTPWIGLWRHEAREPNLAARAGKDFMINSECGRFGIAAAFGWRRFPFPLITDCGVFDPIYFFLER